jgi:hypothetical protein
VECGNFWEVEVSGTLQRAPTGGAWEWTLLIEPSVEIVLGQKTLCVRVRARVLFFGFCLSFILYFSLHCFPNLQESMSPKMNTNFVSFLLVEHQSLKLKHGAQLLNINFDNQL